jgi:hypothetical protein
LFDLSELSWYTPEILRVFDTPPIWSPERREPFEKPGGIVDQLLRRPAREANTATAIRFSG